MNEALVRYRYVLFSIIALGLAGVVGYGLVHRPPPLAFNVLPPQPTPLPTSAPTPGPVRVHVTGAVKVPGVYTLPPGALVQDALEIAGGPTDDADPERVNLAAAVQDEQQIIIPRGQVDGSSRSGSGILESRSNGLVDVNSADSETLQTLPGIGPTMAERIIAHREENGLFSSVEDLVNVKGIGEATLEKLRPLTTVGP